MTKILNGTKLAEKINQQSRSEISKMKSNPHLVAIQVGENKESTLYIKHKSSKAKEIGLKFTHLKINEGSTTTKIIEKISEMNIDNEVDGIMVQLPLPDNFDTDAISQSIAPWKDVDGFHPLNKGLLDIGKAELIPPTALGVMELLKEEKIKVKGKHVVIVGVGEISGKPLAKLFLNKNATITMCNRHTKDIFEHVEKADIVVAAVGHKHLIKNEHIKEGVIVINIGITKDEKGIHGDIEYDSMLEKASYITPIVGGTGPMTVALLLKNTLLCHKLK